MVNRSRFRPVLASLSCMLLACSGGSIGPADDGGPDGAPVICGDVECPPGLLCIDGQCRAGDPCVPSWLRASVPD